MLCAWQLIKSSVKSPAFFATTASKLNLFIFSTMLPQLAMDCRRCYCGRHCGQHLRKCHLRTRSHSLGGNACLRAAINLQQRRLLLLLLLGGNAFDIFKISCVLHFGTAAEDVCLRATLLWSRASNVPQSGWQRMQWLLINLQQLCCNVLFNFIGNQQSTKNNNNSKVHMCNNNKNHMCNMQQHTTRGTRHNNR